MVRSWLQSSRQFYFPQEIIDRGGRQTLEYASMLFPERGHETGSVFHSDTVTICLEYLAQSHVICQIRSFILNPDRPSSQHLRWDMRQRRWVCRRHNRDVVIESFHALRPNLEILIVTRVKRHVINVEHGPPWSLGHALCILPELTEMVRRDQDELQTIDLTNERLQRECFAHTTLTFEESERHMTPLDERGEHCPKSSHILLLIDDLIALRFLNLNGLKFALRSGFKNLVLGKRVLVQLMHERYHVTEFSGPVRRDSKSPVELSFGASVSIAEGQNLFSLYVFEISLVYPLKCPQKIFRIRLYLHACAIQRLFRQEWMLHKHIAGQLTEKNILIRGPHDQRRLPCVGEDQDLLLFEID